VAKKEKEIEKKDSSETPEESSGFNIKEFADGAKEELTKIVWPSRQQLISESVAVVLMVTLIASLIYVVDNFFGWGAREIFK
jgi:preprotein translocase subunit SecE